MHFGAQIATAALGATSRITKSSPAQAHRHLRAPFLSRLFVFAAPITTSAAVAYRASLGLNKDKTKRPVSSRPSKTDASTRKHLNKLRRSLIESTGADVLPPLEQDDEDGILEAIRDLSAIGKTPGSRSPLIGVTPSGYQILPYLPPPEIPNGLFPGFTPYLSQYTPATGWALETPSIYKWLLLPDTQQEVPGYKQKKPQINYESSSRMHSFVQLISTPTADTPGASLLLHFPNKRYFFGHIAEGTQRINVERGVGMTKVTDIFLTGPINSHNTAGLLGMILTIADVHTLSTSDLVAANILREEKGKEIIPIPKESLNIHGGRNLAHMLASGRYFVLRNNFPVTPFETIADPRSQDPTSTVPDFEDELIKVWKVPVTMSASSPSSANPRKRRRDESPKPTGSPLPTVEQGVDDQRVRESVVKAMFDSGWRLDQLQECMLSEVELPATIFVRDDHGKIQKYDGPLPGRGRSWTDIRVLVRKPWPAVKVHKLPSTTPSHDSMCYIVKEQQRRGKFLPHEGVRLGVPRHMNKFLTMGENVTLEDGTVITPDMVMEPPATVHGFAVIDIRHPDLLDGLLARPEWSNKELMEGLAAMYWIIDGSVRNDARLAEFMNRFPGLQHIVLGEHISPNVLTLGHSASQTSNLNKIDEDRFPLQKWSDTTAELSPSMPQGTRLGRAGEVLQLAPTIKFQEDQAFKPVHLDPHRLYFVPSHKTVSSLAEHASENRKQAWFQEKVETSEADIPQRDAEIITLGTGSSLPSKNRNVSATLLRIPGHGNYLLDCGENTLGQLRRTYGYEAADDILRDLRVIYISHLHADHHLGTTRVLARLAKLQQQEQQQLETTDPSTDDARPPVTVICPKRYLDFLKESQQLEDLGRFTWLTRAGGARQGTIPHTRVEWDQPPEWIQKNTGLAGLHAVFVDHCADAMAVCMTWPSGLKVAFSGDCRPSSAFANLARGAHLLIHECTFDDDRSGDAEAKKHSTISEALDVGRQMQARRILLTHFSQRYPKMQSEETVAEGLADKHQESWHSTPVVASTDRPVGEQTVLFAFDQMRVRLGEFQHAAQSLPALRVMCNSSEYDDGYGSGSGSNYGSGSERQVGNGNGNGGKNNKKGGKGKKWLKNTEAGTAQEGNKASMKENKKRQQEEKRLRQEQQQQA